VIEVIEYLKEIETRELHLARGFSSMFAFATEFLGYSEAEAHNIHFVRDLEKMVEILVDAQLKRYEEKTIKVQEPRKDQRTETSRVTCKVQYLQKSKSNLSINNEVPAGNATIPNSSGD
jgi:hypothetical protein